MTRKYTGDLTDLARAVTEFELTLPGWWWEVGSCSISSTARCGPDILGPDAELMRYNQKAFDGFDLHLTNEGASCADALRAVMREAIKAKAEMADSMGNGTITFLEPQNTGKPIVPIRLLAETARQIRRLAARFLRDS